MVDYQIPAEIYQKMLFKSHPRLHKVFLLRINGKTYKNIGLEVGGVTVERARQLFYSAISKMKRFERVSMGNLSPQYCKDYPTEAIDDKLLWQFTLKKLLPFKNQIRNIAYQ